jgi:hypothetical protein
MLLILPGLLRVAGLSLPAQEIMPTGITCCDEQKIRQAMTEEALARIAAKCEPGSRGNREAGDYLSEQAYEKIRKHLPAGGMEQHLVFLRDILQRPAMDMDIKEFQNLVGYFALGMTLEIGNTLQDEYDQAQKSLEDIGKFIEELEKSSSMSEWTVSRARFQTDLSAKELRRVRTLARKWKDAPDGASPFDEFNMLKKNITGRPSDPDQGLVFDLAEHWRSRFPFLDEFLEKYRRLAKDFRETTLRLNILFSGIGA